MCIALIFSYNLIYEELRTALFYLLFDLSYNARPRRPSHLQRTAIVLQSNELGKQIGNI